MSHSVACSTPETRCPDCGGRLRRTEELVCESCALVVESDPIDHGPEWRCLDDDDEESPRCGRPTSPRFHDGGLATKIGIQSDLNELPRAKRKRLRRQKRWHKHARTPDKTDRTERDLLGEIRRIASVVDLVSGAVDRACVVGSEAARQGLLQGRSIDTIAAAAVHIGARQSDVYRRDDSIAAAAHCSPAALRSAVTTLQIELELKVPILRPTDVLPAALEQLPGSVPPEFQRDCLALAREVEQSADVRGSPSGLAGGVVYALDDGTHWTQPEVAEAAQVHAYTVRDNAKKIRSDLGDGQKRLSPKQAAVENPA